MNLVFITQNNDNLEDFVDVNFDQQLSISVRESG